MEQNRYTMETKTTDELRHEIKGATDIEDYLKNNRENLIHYNLTRHLNRLLSQKGISKAEVVRGSLLSKAYVYQIFSGERTPSRDKLIAIAFGLRLSEKETQDLLKISGKQELYAREERDAIILFSIQRNQSIFEVNDLLFEHAFNTLGISEES